MFMCAFFPIESGRSRTSIPTALLAHSTQARQLDEEHEKDRMTPTCHGTLHLEVKKGRKKTCEQMHVGSSNVYIQ